MVELDLRKHFDPIVSPELSVFILHFSMPIYVPQDKMKEWLTAASTGESKCIQDCIKELPMAMFDFDEILGMLDASNPQLTTFCGELLDCIAPDELEFQKLFDGMDREPQIQEICASLLKKVPKGKLDYVYLFEYTSDELKKTNKGRVAIDLLHTHFTEELKYQYMTKVHQLKNLFD